MKPLLLPLLLALSTGAQPRGGAGVLLLAHGGDPTWNETVSKLAAAVRGTRDVEVAFGMADGDAMQAAVSKLEKAGDRRIVAVPLFVSSHSNLYRHTAYLLGVAAEPSKEFLDAMGAMAHAGHVHGHHMDMDAMNRRVKTKLPVSLAPALDADPLVGRILAERAKALSKDPSKEALVLVAHGPIEEDDDKAWLADLGKLAEAVRSQLPFAETAVATLRDDAPPPVREAAVKKLRGTVETLSKSYAVLVVPVVVAPGGIEAKMKKDLDGLEFRWDGRTLAPDALLADWIESRVKETDDHGDGGGGSDPGPGQGVRAPGGHDGRRR
jgi:sirohydrochlorin ferrochelatase